MTTRQAIGAGTVQSTDGSPQRQERLRRLMRMRCAAEHLATARFLEQRAERAATPALADLLRERAGERRRRGERLLAGPPD